MFKEKEKKKTDKKKSVKKSSSKTVMLRDANTGTFSQGKQPAGSPTGKNGGVPYWEVQMFIRVVDTVITKEIEIAEVLDNDNKSEGVLLSEIEQSEHDVLHGESLSGHPK